ncbi:GPO family capsid scaffolding protein [Methyloversatilis sp.]|uniref:GPO family capsid scaffolding protein n=1 Tax=Methyloversatilis sp. TaxID=2569862 RepID=UPI002732AD57|nr:GPO family capsid scaffolding protein [Methyloversatilis sp.]MDP3579155.1 GPO family capsid scaffolding protein [Methyloversatilis sp.]
MAKTKFIRVMTEGATSDGRTIERGWIEQMARTYNPIRYGARIWLEHLRGLYPDSTFRAYGDVVAVKAEVVEDGKLALFVQLDPTPDLIEMNKARQKIYTSAEVDSNFARSGEAYLVGLAVTDSPASLGTEMLQFAAQAKSNPLSQRKQSPDNVFTAATPITLEFEDTEMTTANKPVDAPKADGETKTLLNAIIGMLKPAEKKGDEVTAQPSDDFAAALTEVAKHQAETAKALAEFSAAAKTQGDAQATKVEELSADLKKLSEKFAALTAKLDQTPGQHSKRPPATGGDGTEKQLADC